MRRPDSGFTSSPSSSCSVLFSSTRYRRSFMKHSATGRSHSPVIERRCSPATILQRLGVEGDDLVLSEIDTIAEHNKEQPAGREDRGVDRSILICVGRDHGAVVSEAVDLVVRPSRIKELLAGGDIASAARQLEAATAAHVAREGAHPCAKQIPRKVERHSCQAAPALAGCFPAVRPSRAHGGRRAVRQLQRCQHVRHQVTREQHSLNRPLRQRLVRCDNGVGPVPDFGRRLAPCGRDFQELRVREVEKAQRYARDRRHLARAVPVARLPARRVGG
eukprot:scaffold100706_cov70-Phaeocystis_antarctica.AAC.2